MQIEHAQTCQIRVRSGRRSLDFGGPSVSDYLAQPRHSDRPRPTVVCPEPSLQAGGHRFDPGTLHRRFQAPPFHRQVPFRATLVAFEPQAQSGFEAVGAKVLAWTPGSVADSAARGSRRAGLRRCRRQCAVSRDARRDRPDHEREHTGKEAEAEVAVFAEAVENRDERDQE